MQQSIYTAILTLKHNGCSCCNDSINKIVEDIESSEKVKYEYKLCKDCINSSCPYINANHKGSNTYCSCFQLRK